MNWELNKDGRYVSVGESGQIYEVYKTNMWWFCDVNPHYSYMCETLEEAFEEARSDEEAIKIDPAQLGKMEVV